MQKIIDIPGYGEVEFPDTMDDAAISAAAKRLYDQRGSTMAPPPMPKPPIPAGLQQQRGSIDPTLAAMTVGVPYDVFGERLLGATASLIHPLLPGGSTRDTRRTLPELTPEQQIGERAAIVATALPAAASLGSTAVRSIAGRAGLPDSLMVNAARARSAVENVAPSMPMSTMGTIGQGAKMMARPVVNTGARIGEELAQWLAKNDQARQVIARPNVFSGTPHDPTPLPVRTGFTPPENVPPVDPMRGPFPGEVRQPIGAVRPQSQYAPPIEEPPFVGELRGPAGPPQPVPMTEFPNPNAIPNRLATTAPELNKWMNVQTRQMVHGANPGEQILADGLLGPTKEATLANVDNALTEVGGQMNQLMRDAATRGARIDGEQLVMDALVDATKTIGKRTDSAFQTALTNVLNDILYKYPDLKNLSPEQAHALKVDIGDAVQWGRGAAYEADVNQVLVDIYKKMNGEIRTNVPGIDTLQSRWGNLYQGKQALKGSILKDQAGRGTGAVFGQRTKPKDNLAARVEEALRLTRGAQQ